MDAVLANRLAASLRAADPDRYFSTLFAPAPRRPYLIALYAFNNEVARVAETVREPDAGRHPPGMVARDGGRRPQRHARNHDVAKGLAALFQAFDLPLKDFESLIAARAFDSSADHFPDIAALETHLDATSGTLMRLAIKVLGGDTALAREPALAYGLTGLLRSLRFHNARHKLYMPLDLLAAVEITPEQFFDHAIDPRVNAVTHQLGLRARDHFLAARRGPKPRASLPALLPAALVPVYLRRLGREVPIHRRQMALLAAAMKKRL